MFDKTIFRLFSAQYRLPSGPLGRFVGKKMDKLNDAQSDWVISLLQLKVDDTVLDVGFGTGRVLKTIAPIVTKGKIYGLDPSGTMHRVAENKLKKEIRSGQIRLHQGFAEHTSFSPDTFTKIYAIHVVYFWEDLLTVFRELFRICAKDGLLAVYFVSPILAANKNFHEYSETEIEDAMKKAGFKTIQVKHQAFGKQNGICILARK